MFLPKTKIRLVLTVVGIAVVMGLGLMVFRPSEPAIGCVPGLDEKFGMDDRCGTNAARQQRESDALMDSLRALTD